MRDNTFRHTASNDTIPPTGVAYSEISRTSHNSYIRAASQFLQPRVQHATLRFVDGVTTKGILSDAIVNDPVVPLKSEGGRCLSLLLQPTVV